MCISDTVRISSEYEMSQTSYEFREKFVCIPALIHAYIQKSADMLIEGDLHRANK